MKKIPLTHGKFALVDDEDFDELNKFKWHIRNGYATRNGTQKNRVRSPQVSMARCILGVKSWGEWTDHISGDKLDNRRANLRIVTPQQNGFNRGKNRNNTSGFKGVFWDEGTKKWRASIMVDGKQRYLGIFEDKIQAHFVYAAAAEALHGEFAHA